MMEKNIVNPAKLNEFLEFFPEKGGLMLELSEYFKDNPEDWKIFKKEFSKIKRWGDLREGIRPNESNWEHVLEMYEISRELMEKFPKEFEDIDVEKMLAMIGLHDIGELNKKGDIPATEKHGNPDLHKKIERREKITAYSVLKKIKNIELQNKLSFILKEYELRESKEARLVKMIDVMQANRKYARDILPLLEQEDLEKAAENIKNIQINDFVEKGIKQISRDFPEITKYLQNDFENNLKEFDIKIQTEMFFNFFNKKLLEIAG